MRAMQSVHVVVTLIWLLGQAVQGQYREISRLPPHLRNLSHCPAPGYFGDSSSCVRFYRCVDYGIPNYPMLLRHDFNCAAGTVFDPSLSVCNHPSKVHLSSGCHLQYAGGRVVPTIPPFQGLLESNSLVDPNTDSRLSSGYLGPRSSPSSGAPPPSGGYYLEPEMLIQTRINNFPSRKWANNYVVATSGPVVHLQVQVPYTVNNN